MKRKQKKLSRTHALSWSVGFSFDRNRLWSSSPDQFALFGFYLGGGLPRSGPPPDVVTCASFSSSSFGRLHHFRLRLLDRRDPRVIRAHYTRSSVFSSSASFLSSCSVNRFKSHFILFTILSLPPPSSSSPAARHVLLPLYFVLWSTALHLLRLYI